MELLNPITIAKPGPGYAQGTSVGGIVFVAGQVSIDAQGQIVGKGDIVTQTRQTLNNVRAVVEAGGLTMRDIASTTVYVKDLADYKGFAETWVAVFGDHAPARATVKADLVHPDLLIEVQAIAAK